LTGYGTPEALERSRRAGFDHHLIKPVNPEALYRLLNTDESAGDSGVERMPIEGGSGSALFSAARGGW